MRFGIERALVRELDRVAAGVKDAGTQALRGAVDETAVQLHLGVLEAKERLALIDPFLRKVLHRAERAKSDIKDFAAPAKLHLALARMEIADAIDARRRRAHEELATLDRATEHALDELVAHIDKITSDLRE
jgi:hypothetical protein